MIRVAIIGVGYWGPNLLRNFNDIPDCRVTLVCDRDEKRLQSVCEGFPSVRATTDVDDVFNGQVDAVVIATPAKTHYALTRRALEAGLHAFVEKPLATTVGHCEQLVEIAKRQKVVLFVGHIFLYSAPVIKLKEIVESGELGEPYYVSSTRLNLGPVRHDVSALWDLAPHDVSIILELMGTMPDAVSCSGLARLNQSVHDVCNLTLHYGGKKLGLIHVSWLDPNKTRVMTVVGSKRMAVYNDLEPIDKIKVYDRGIDVPLDTNTENALPLNYRHGDYYSPTIGESEPLKLECQTFLDCIAKQKTPHTDGQNGLQVVKVIETASLSLNNGNGRVPLERFCATNTNGNGSTPRESGTRSTCAACLYAEESSRP